MAYSKKVATCIIGPDGKVYDEDPRGVVAVPFDSEFKVRVINKNDRKIGFDIFVDGEKVTKTGRIIVNAHDRVDLERYIENDDNGTKFRFVSKDSQESKMEGKDKEPYTGLVEVKVYFEKERPREIIREVHHDHIWHDHHHHYPKPFVWYSDNSGGFHGYSGISGWSGCTGSAGQTGSAGSNNYSMFCSTSDVSAKSMNCNFTSSLDEGAVVRGGNSNQAFGHCYVDLEEDYVSLKMYLMGYTLSENIRQKVEEAMTKKDQKEKQLEFDFMKDPKYVTKFCRGCGNKVSKDDNFCGKCGGKL